MGVLRHIRSGPAAEPVAKERLDSWKEIAAYFDRSVRTVQYWEREEGLPVHRLHHTKRQSVYAISQELEAWRDSRQRQLNGEPGAPKLAVPHREARANRRRRWALAAAAVVATVILVWTVSRYLPPRALEEVASALLPVVPFTSYPGLEIHPSFSPDGSQIAFAWNGPQQDNFDIYVKLVGPGDSKRLTTQPARDYSPAWSPDGKFIAFQRDLGGHRAAVMLVPALGGREKLLAEVQDGSLGRIPPPDPRLAWTPDSRQLVFADRVPGSETSALFLLTIETCERRQIASPIAEGASPRAPAFSPDGRNLAFVHRQRVWVLSLSDSFEAVGEVREIGQLVGYTYYVRPLWSPDGKEVLFPAAGRLWRTTISGAATAQPVTSIVGAPSYPVLSHSTGRLAYVEHSEDTNIWRAALVETADDTAKSSGLVPSTKAESWPQFSPDGSQIVFASTRSGRMQVWKCDNDGTSIVRLTTAHGGSPRWSPDGSRIAFDSFRDGNAEVYVMDAEGRNQRRLTTNPTIDFVPSWSRDGRWIYFGSNRTKPGQIWKVPADGGEPVQVTRDGGAIAIESVDGEYVFYTKHTGQSSLWRVPASGGEETQILDAVHMGSFAVTGDGIYFIPVSESGEYTVELFRFSTNEIEAVARLERPAGYGLSVLPDGKSVLYCQQDSSNADLMLVENFR